MELANTTQSDRIDENPEGELLGEPAKVVKLSDLLEDFSENKTSEGAKEEGAASGDATKKAKPEMFNDLADSLGVTLDDLYKLKVSTNDGKTVTIEELKSLQGTQDELTIRELEFEESRVTKESGLRQAQNELAEVVSALPDGTLNPEMLAKLRAKNEARVGVEQQRTVEAIPSWSDEKTRTDELVGMSQHMERFGFPANHLASVVDHRMLVFIRESHLREQRIQKALAKVRAGKPNPTTSTKATGKAPSRKVATRQNSETRNGLESFLSNATEK